MPAKFAAASKLLTGRIKNENHGFCNKFNINIYEEVYMTNALQGKVSVNIFCGHNKKFFKKQQDSHQIKNNAIIRREEKNSPDDGGTNNKATVRVSKRQGAFFV
jgi:hypothetical protein